MSPSSRVLRAACLVLLGVGTLALYWATGRFAFLNFDDDVYVTANPLLAEGWTAAAAWRAVVSFHAANWHPVTWWSHLLDVSLFGFDPGAQHRVNALLHALNALLAFEALAALTRGTALAREAPRARLLAVCGAAALFAWHPLRVESVAWVAERKDLLGGGFALAALWAYASYARRPGVGRHLLVGLLLALSLGAKPMAVTLPFLFLVLDRWPLGRGLVLREKLPWLVLVLAVVLLTLRAQGEGGAFEELRELTFLERLDTALRGYATYLRQFLWPADLAFFYPHPALADPAGYAPLGAMAWGALGVLAVASLAAWRLRGRAPWLAAGWCWFLGMGVPVIGLVQVGAQAHADRYTYLPTIGLGLALAWSAASAPRLRAPLGVAGLVVLALLVVRSAEQRDTWRDSRTLAQHAIAVTRENYLAHTNLGHALEAAGDLAGARHHYAIADRLRPGHPGIRYNLAHLDALEGNWAAAEAGYRALLARWPDDFQALADLGVLLASQNRDREALPPLLRAWEAPLPVALRERVGQPLAWILATSSEEALRDGRRALEVARACASVHPAGRNLYNLAAALAENGDFAGAQDACRRALADPQLAALPGVRNPLAAYEAGRPFRKGASR